MEKLSKQDLKFSREIPATERRLARGEYPLYIPQNLTSIRDLKGLPVKFLTPREGLPFIGYDLALLKNAPHPNAARLLMDYYLGQKMQKSFADLGLLPVTSRELPGVDPAMAELERASCSVPPMPRKWTRCSCLRARYILKLPYLAWVAWPAPDTDAGARWRVHNAMPASGRSVDRIAERNRLRSPSRRAVNGSPASLSGRILARDGFRARAGPPQPEPHQLPAERPAVLPARLDAGRRDEGGSSLATMQEHVLDRYKPRFGILNCLYGAQVFHSEDMAAAFCRATNDWIRDEWLGRDPRLRASIVIPAHNTELAVAEIERRADEFRFVQVLMLVSGEVTLGRRQLWPIYQARRTAGPADRRSRRQRVSLCADRRRVAVLLCRGLHRAVRRVRKPACRA